MREVCGGRGSASSGSGVDSLLEILEDILDTPELGLSPEEL
jgi:hypothetical protein